MGYEFFGEKIIFPSALVPGIDNDQSLIKIKSLNSFQFSTVSSITSSQTMNRQCFTVKDGKCTLKHSHNYYNQVQMQLLVTERKFCDFVLYAENGPVSIERIYRDGDPVDDILKLLSLF